MSETSQAEQEPNEAKGNEIHQLVNDLFEVGKLWASHGLNIGKQSLHHSARSLELTAATLGVISRRLSSDAVSSDAVASDAASSEAGETEE
jgi:hypothetical protein